MIDPDIYWEEDEVLGCYNHCDWVGTIADLYNPEEDIYKCPKCGGSTDMILSLDI
jgi:hypothetical protein